MHASVTHSRMLFLGSYEPFLGHYFRIICWCSGWCCLDFQYLCSTTSRTDLRGRGRHTIIRYYSGGGGRDRPTPMAWGWSLDAA